MHTHTSKPGFGGNVANVKLDYNWIHKGNNLSLQIIMWFQPQIPAWQPLLFYEIMAHIFLSLSHWVHVSVCLHVCLVPQTDGVKAIWWCTVITTMPAIILAKMTRITVTMHIAYMSAAAAAAAICVSMESSVSTSHITCASHCPWPHFHKSVLFLHIWIIALCIPAILSNMYCPAIYY